MADLDIVKVSQALGAMADKPYGPAIGARIGPLLLSGNFNQDSVTDIVMEEFRNHLKTLPENERFASIKDLKDIASGVMDSDGQAKLNDLMGKLDQAGEGIQNALAHAIANNDNFLDYILDKAGEAGTQGSNDFINQAIDSIFVETENGKVIDPQKAGPLQDILTTIGNNPDYDFSKLEDVARTTQEYTHSKTLDNAEAERNALSNMVAAVRAAGGNVNAFATLDMADIMQFMEDLFSGRGAEYAISRFAENLGLEGQQLADFQGTFQPIAGIMNFMAKDFVEVGQVHGQGIKQKFEGLQQSLNNVSGGVRISFQKDTDGEINTNISREDFIKEFKLSMAGQDPKNPEAIEEAVIKADHKMADEIYNIQHDITLNREFNDVADINKLAEKLADLRDGINKIHADNNNVDLTGNEVVKRAVSGLNL